MKQQRSAPAALDDADAIVCEPKVMHQMTKIAVPVQPPECIINIRILQPGPSPPRRGIGCCGLATAALNIVGRLWPPARVTVVYAFTAPNSQTRSLPHHHETNAETSALPCLGPRWLNGRANLKFLNALATSSYSALVNLLK